jgi:histidyl-tRNA synthetase
VLQGKNDKNLTERALKYDLTIPFARYVAMNHGQLTFPFKRYQVQPVWRPTGRKKALREFYQCDADIVGSNALLNEVEFVNIYNDVFNQLGIKNYELRINSRKILAALAEICGGADKMMDITIAIDKLDKIGIEKVKEELAGRGLSTDQINTIEKYLDITGSNEEKLSQIKQLLANSETGRKGIGEIEFILSMSKVKSETLKVKGETSRTILNCRKPFTFHLSPFTSHNRLHSRPRPQLLHRHHLRSKGAGGSKDRQHWRRRQIRRPHRPFWCS